MIPRFQRMRKGLRGPRAAQGSLLWGWEWGLRTLPGILRHPQPISRGFFQALFTCSISGSNSHCSLNIPHSKAPAPQKSPFPLKGAHSTTPCIPPWGIHASLKTLHQGPAGCRDHLHMDLHTQHFSREFALSGVESGPSTAGKAHPWKRGQSTHRELEGFSSNAAWVGIPKCSFQALPALNVSLGSFPGSCGNGIPPQPREGGEKQRTAKKG